MGVRARLTLLAPAVLAVPLLALALLLSGVLREQVLAQAGQEAETHLNGGPCQRSETVSEMTLTPGKPLPGSLFGCVQVQFVVRATVLGGLTLVRAEPDQLLTLLPFAARPPAELLHTRSGQAPMLLPDSEDYLRRAQQRLDGYVLGLTGGLLALLGLSGWLAWLLLGRLLRPVAQARAELAERAAHELRVSAQRRFVASAAHELRGPIAALRGELELATAHPEQADWPEVVRLALSDTVRLQELATDLLLLARLENPGPAGQEEIDLADLVHSHLAERAAPPHLERSAQLPAWPVVVTGRTSALTRLLDNLLDNAERHAERFLEVRVSAEDGQAVLEVVDDGPGIPLMERGRVFEPFARLDDARSRDVGGSGLGLAIARQIVDNHGGRIWAGRGPGGRIQARLPLSRLG